MSLCQAWPCLRYCTVTLHRPTISWTGPEGILLDRMQQFQIQYCINKLWMHRWLWWYLRFNRCLCVSSVDHHCSWQMHRRVPSVKPVLLDHSSNSPIHRSVHFPDCRFNWSPFFCSHLFISLLQSIGHPKYIHLWFSLQLGHLNRDLDTLAMDWIPSIGLENSINLNLTNLLVPFTILSYNQ
jgi:hypothetical protein